MTHRTVVLNAYVTAGAAVVKSTQLFVVFPTAKKEFLAMSTMNPKGEEVLPVRNAVVVGFTM